MNSNERIGRFSTGQETQVGLPEHRRIGSFSDGQAAGPAEPAVVGRFSTGQEALAESPEHVRVGSFGDVETRRVSITVHRVEERAEGLETVTS
jgi:hypothetical protein